MKTFKQFLKESDFVVAGVKDSKIVGGQPLHKEGEEMMEELDDMAKEDDM